MVTKAMSVREVAKQIYAEYFHDTIYSVSLHTILRRVEALKRVYSEDMMRYSQNRDNSRVENYKKLFGKEDKLFDFYAEDSLR